MLNFFIQLSWCSNNIYEEKFMLHWKEYARKNTINY